MFPMIDSSELHQRENPPKMNQHVPLSITKKASCLALPLWKQPGFYQGGGNPLMGIQCATGGQDKNPREREDMMLQTDENPLERIKTAKWGG